jgi:hypothetical protein
MSHYIADHRRNLVCSIAVVDAGISVIYSVSDDTLNNIVESLNVKSPIRIE